MFAKAPFQSMVSRITFSMLAVIVVAEVFVGAIWYTSNAESKKESAWNAMSAITTSASDTINYFVDLPTSYRHLVLQQLRNMGGTRFFISINSHHLDVQSLENYTLVEGIEQQSIQLLQQKMKYPKESSLVITHREDLVVFDSEIKLDELPALWKDYSLVLGDLDLPIVVIQTKLDDGWLYMATVLPLSYNSLTNVIFETKQLVFLVIATILLLGVAYIVAQKEVRPFRSLARSASLMSARMEVEPIEEEGSVETRAAIHAFNKMNQRIKSYLRDRELFFNAVSHDIKTPLACLKLRTEMLDDDQARLRFEKLLNDMELMLDGALQCLKDEGIHEDLDWVNLEEVIIQSAELHNREEHRVQVSVQGNVVIFGRPLSIRRCIANLMENGIKYGDYVDVEASYHKGVATIIFKDYGEGVPEDKFEDIFKPYTRLDNESTPGSGLGLAIARTIARTHGGDITMSNDEEQGLIVNLTLESAQ